jgi:hypothetical protein
MALTDLSALQLVVFTITATLMATVVAATTALVVSLVNARAARRLEQERAIRAYRLERLKPVYDYIDLREREIHEWAAGRRRLPFQEQVNFARLYLPYQGVPDELISTIEDLLQAEVDYWRTSDIREKERITQVMLEKLSLVRSGFDTHVFRLSQLPGILGAWQRMWAFRWLGKRTGRRPMYLSADELETQRRRRSKGSAAPL